MSNLRRQTIGEPSRVYANSMDRQGTREHRSGRPAPTRRPRVPARRCARGPRPLPCSLWRGPPR